jgi:hypothetical protein
MRVVPANAGTHTARTQVFGTVSDAFFYHQRQGLLGWTAPDGIDVPE